MMETDTVLASKLDEDTIRLRFFGKSKNFQPVEQATYDLPLEVAKKIMDQIEEIL